MYYGSGAELEVGAEAVEVSVTNQSNKCATYCRSGAEPEVGAEAVEASVPIRVKCVPHIVGQEPSRKWERKQWKRAYHSETREYDSLVVSRVDTNSSPQQKREKEPRNPDDWEPVSYSHRVHSQRAKTNANGFVLWLSFL